MSGGKSTGRYVGKSCGNCPGTEEAASGGTERREGAGGGGSRVGSTESRLRKGASALPSRSRPSAGELRYSLAHRLTDRDRAVVAVVRRHRALTAHQLAELFFDSYTRASARLLLLTEMRVLARFRPHRATGTNPFHYVLGPFGAAVAAAEKDEDPDAAARRWRGERVLALGRTQRLAHLMGVNAFFVALAAKARRCDDVELLDWLTEAECARWTEGIVRPDAFGHWREGGSSVEFFLEHDRGTETLARLVAKLDGYAAFEAERGASAWVLFAFASERREARARRALDRCSVPVATAVLADPPAPHEVLWLPIRPTGPRVRLAALAAVPKPPEATRRATQGSPRAWRFARSRPDDEEEAPIETT